MNALQTRRFNPNASGAATATPVPQASPPASQPGVSARSPLAATSALLASGAATAPRSALKKISFAAAPAKVDDTKSVYPVMPDPTGEIAIISQRIQERKDQLDALEGALEIDKGELKMIVGAHYYAVTHGKSDIPSGISAIASDGQETLVLFTKRLSKPKGRDKKTVSSEIYESLLAPVLGDLLPEFFKQTATLKVDCSQLPEAGAQEIVNEIIAVLQKYAAVDALDISETLDCTPDFHIARHSRLTVEQNMALEGICPIVAQIKTKGRK